jgi:hypothetical protein
MKLNVKAAILAVSAAGLSLTAGTAAAADEPVCETPWKESVIADLTDPGRWTYTYQVFWCVKDGKIIHIKSSLTHGEDGRTCVWVANAEEAHKPLDEETGDWMSFNMGQLSCKGGDGKPDTVNPWSEIIIRPDGSSEVFRKGVGDVIHSS